MSTASTPICAKNLKSSGRSSQSGLIRVPILIITVASCYEPDDIGTTPSTHFGTGRKVCPRYTDPNVNGVELFGIKPTWQTNLATSNLVFLRSLRDLGRFPERCKWPAPPAFSLVRRRFHSTACQRIVAALSVNDCVTLRVVFVYEITHPYPLVQVSKVVHTTIATKNPKRVNKVRRMMRSAHFLGSSDFIVAVLEMASLCKLGYHDAVPGQHT